jgi:GGDEF domain-containing protein
MLASKRLGPSQRIRRRHLAEAPTIDVFTSYLRELLGAPPGARFDFSWDSGEQTYTTTLIYDHRVQIADWKLYKGIEPHSTLVWEHRTNDIPLLFNLISMQTGHSDKVCEAEMTLANNHGAELASPEAKHGNYMVRNLQKLFVEAQNNWSPAQYEMEMQNDSLSSGNWPQYAVQAKAPAHPAPEAPTFSTNPTHTVNLYSGRGLLQSLLVNELGVLSFSALLFLLEQEYYKANTNNSNLTVVLFKIASNIGANIPRSGIQQVLHDIKARLRKTDMLAQYENGLFAFVLPETDLAGAKLFARKVGKFLANPQNYPGPGGAGLKVSFGLAGLNQSLPTLPLLLGGAEKALDLAEIGNNPIATYDDFVHSLESPWSGTQSETPATPQKGLNLVPMRQLLGQLLEEELNIFTYAAWLLFLEREFHRAQRSKKMLLTLIIRLRMHDLRANDPSNLLPSEALAEAFQRISHLQRKGDITGHFTNGNYAILRPNASIKSLETFSKQIKDALTQTPLTPDFDYGAFRIGIQLCTVRGEAASPDCLNFYPMQIQ